MRRHIKLDLEALEDRTVPAVFDLKSLVFVGPQPEPPTKPVPNAAVLKHLDKIQAILPAVQLPAVQNQASILIGLLNEGNAAILIGLLNPGKTGNTEVNPADPNKLGDVFGDTVGNPAEILLPSLSEGGQVISQVEANLPAVQILFPVFNQGDAYVPNSFLTLNDSVSNV